MSLRLKATSNWAGEVQCHPAVLPVPRHSGRGSGSTRLWFELDSKAGPGVPLLAGVNLLTGNLKPGAATPRRHAAGAQAGEAQKPEANGAKGQ